jgi:hypothetical protein
VPSTNQAAEAIPHLHRAQEMFQGTGDQVGAAEALHNIGYAQLKAGRGREAAQSLAEARQVAAQATLRGSLQRPNTAVPGFDIRSGTGTAAATALARTAGPAVTSRLTTAAAREVDADKLATALGTENFELKFRSIGKQVASSDLKLVTPAQQQAESFGRTFSLRTAGETVNLNWSVQQPLAASAVSNLLNVRATSTMLTDVGFRPVGPSETALLLPHLYQLVLPIKMGDCLHQLNQFALAHQEYLRASQYDGINKALEAPDPGAAWRKTWLIGAIRCTATNRPRKLFRFISSS